jgi:hypothetical protein
MSELESARCGCQEKFENVWNAIIEKYELGSDEGDVVDLWTGEILEDRGHLSRLPFSTEY